MTIPFSSRETVRKNLDETLWIEVKKELNYGDKRALRRPFLHVAIEGDEAVVETVLQEEMEEANVQLMLCAIVDWNFQIEGERIEITREAIDNLKDEVATAIVAILDRQYKPMRAARKKK